MRCENLSLNDACLNCLGFCFRPVNRRSVRMSWSRVRTGDALQKRACIFLRVPSKWTMLRRQQSRLLVVQDVQTVRVGEVWVFEFGSMGGVWHVRAEAIRYTRNRKRYSGSVM